MKIIFLEKKGFTLIEVLSATLILTVALLGVASSFSRGSVFISEIRERYVATQAAQEEIELIRDMSFNNILALGSSFTAAGFSSLNTPTGTVIVDDPYSDSNIRRVTVTVDWISSRGRNLSRNLVTLVTREGINRQ